MAPAGTSANVGGRNAGRTGPVDGGDGRDGDGLRVLVVEDDEAIAVQLARGLDRAGYRTTRVATVRDALDALGTTQPPEMVLLDLGLPDLDGTEVCRTVRENGQIPVIVVTARGDEADRVAALDLGADDYLVKPFGFAELLARMRAVRRRTSVATGAGAGTGPDVGRAAVDRPPAVLRHGPLEIDQRSRLVRVTGRPVSLTAKEFDLLVYLAADPGRVRSRDEIFAAVWGGPWFGPTKVLDVHMGALRRKIGVPGLVETVYGIGFRLADPPPGGRATAPT